MTKQMFFAMATAVALTITTGQVAAAAPAPIDAIEIVAHAESVLGLADDSISNGTRVAPIGAPLSVGSHEAPLTVIPVDHRARASSDGRTPTYTIDQLDSSSTRLAAVLADAGESARWQFADDVELIPLADGRVTVSNAEGDLLGGIEAPWAVDAGGSRLTTRYIIDGSTLQQEVTVDSDTVFPIVADPTIRTFPGYYQISFSKSESITLVGTVASCAALLSKAPHPAMRGLMVGCGVFAAFSTAQLSGGKCVRAHIVGLPPTIGTWWPTFPTC